jgi:TonB family protein
MKKLNRLFALVLMVSAASVAHAEDRQVVRQQIPEYPALLKKLKIGGTVKLNALVAADGTVKKTKISGGNPMLAELASMAVSKWKYAPSAQATNEAVEMTFDAQTALITIK